MEDFLYILIKPVTTNMIFFLSKSFLFIKARTIMNESQIFLQ